MSGGGVLATYLSPRKRLDTLFMVHSLISICIGTLGYVIPSTLEFVFTVETPREQSIGRAMYRPLCSLLIAQGLIIHKARKINDGQIKRAFVQAYFVCFFLATIGLILEHTYYNKAGVVDGRFFGTIKIILMIGLTIGYAWFCFFQPPSVFQGLANYNRYQQ